MSAIEYTSTEEQIEKLKSQGFILSNEEFTEISGTLQLFKKCFNS